MGVRTSADEVLERVKVSIDESVREMRDLIIDEPWGFTDWSQHYRESLEMWLLDLRRLRKRMGEGG